ncbi:hypothetical protein EON64_06350, partial [archaeon]
MAIFAVSLPWQVHRSPGFITSNLVGKREDGIPIREFEASHGTVSDLWHLHLKRGETSLNPLGLIEALMGALNHSAELAGGKVGTGVGGGSVSVQAQEMQNFTSLLRKALHNTFRYGQGTRDISGPGGLTTERFIDKVAWRLGRYMARETDETYKLDLVVPKRSFRRNCKSHLACVFVKHASSRGSAELESTSNIAL